MLIYSPANSPQSLIFFSTNIAGQVIWWFFFSFLIAIYKNRRKKKSQCEYFPISCSPSTNAYNLGTNRPFAPCSSRNLVLKTSQQGRSKKTNFSIGPFSELHSHRQKELWSGGVFMCGIYKCQQTVNGGHRGQSCFVVCHGLYAIAS